MTAKVLEFRRKRADPRCASCKGRGWYRFRYHEPGSTALQETVVVCDCMKGRQGGMSTQTLETPRALVPLPGPPYLPTA